MKFADPTVSRTRLRQVFTFLKALDEHRNPVKRQVREQPWLLTLRKLPEHPDVDLVYPVEESDAGDAAETGRGGFILRVRRPKLTPSPVPPAPYTEWIEGDWKDPSAAVDFRPQIVRSEAAHDSEGATSQDSIELFEEDQDRVAALAGWKVERDRWAARERPARQAMNLFDRLYSLHGRLARVSDEEELVFGDGMLNWRVAAGGLHHPILLQRVDLEFDPLKPEFTVTEADAPVELYSALLRTAEEVDGRVLAGLREELEAGGVSPLLGRSTSAFLKGLISRLTSQGAFLDVAPEAGEEEHPRIWREPVMFLRKRSHGFAAAIASVLEDLERREDVPPALGRIVGCEDESDASEPPITERPVWSEPEEILLSREANTEQVKVAERLARHSSVIVQGPPGTGKTHTIANLVGHLLAQGKSVLVTSHTGKALTVLREKVAEPLQSLCISLLGDDVESRRQLEQSVNGMVERISTSDPAELERRARRLAERRSELLRDVDHLRQRVIESRKGEYRAVVVGGQSLEPAQAARQVAASRKLHEWLPGPIEAGAPLPLTEVEVAELYRSNELLPVQDEEELLRDRLPVAELPEPSEVKALVEQHSAAGLSERGHGSEFWLRPVAAEDERFLRELTGALQEISARLHDADRWWQRLVQVGLERGVRFEAWERFLDEVRALQQRLEESLEPRLRFGPDLPELPLEEQLETVDGIIEHLTAGGRLRWLEKIAHPGWKRFIEGARVGEVQPSRQEHFAALRSQIVARLKAREVAARWKKQAEAIGLPALATDDANLDRMLARHAEAIRSGLDWSEVVWQPLCERLRDLSLGLDLLRYEPTHQLSETHHLDRLQEQVERLEPIVKARAEAARWEMLERHRQKLQEAGQRIRTMVEPAHVCRWLVRALDELSIDEYDPAYTRLKQLEALVPVRDRRRELLRRLAAGAESWAKAIEQRTGVHGQPMPPGAPDAAWQWRQIEEELDRRGAESLPDLHRQIRLKTAELRRITTKLIEQLAWAAQVRRIDLDTQQALIGWQDLVRKTPKRSTVPGKMARLRRAAQSTMRRCQSAVPVWIMPLSRVAESFDFASARFDVVILDEASQTDVTGLLPYYLAERVLIVGDHEQVSPSAVGQKEEIVQHLIREHLQGIPNAELYDGKTSIYDLARASSEGLTRLVEHFRCATEIIQFSNDLCYHGEISPLRDPSNPRIRPPVIPYRVDGPFERRRSKVNAVEAVAVASLVVACAEQPEYDDLSMGVVSMVGDEQAIEIDRLLQSHLSPADYQRHQLVCGNSAQFQGDERDVMFLSLVDLPEDGPLRMRDTPMFRQRFNVAASRARDQEWVVYSVDPETDLKPGDLRKRLIDHARDPAALVRKLDRVERETESEFERQVARRLVERGFKVRPQYKLGYYRIDLVVEGSGARLAIECDGDRWHPIEKLGEDMARQATLERLGCTFVRIRGTQFFRDPDRALEPVFGELERLEILPGAGDDQVEGVRQPALEHELVQRVIARAAQLRREWGGGDEGEEATLVEPQEAGERRIGASDGSVPKAEQTGSAQGGLPFAGSGAVTDPESARVLEFGRSGSRPAERGPAASLSGSAGALPRAVPEAGEDEAGADPPASDDYRERLPEMRGQVWFALSHWAKSASRFQGWERSLLYTIGRNLERDWRVSAKQAKHGKRLFHEGEALGFDPEAEVACEKPGASGEGKQRKAGGARWENIEDVPQSTIRRAILNALPPSGERISRDDLLRRARKQLGFGRLGRKVKVRLNRCIGGLVRAGKLETSGDEISRAR